VGQPDVARLALAAVCTVLAACAAPGEPELRAALANQRTGAIEMPEGVLEIASELVIPAAARDLVLYGPNTVLKAAPGFQGRAVLVVEGASNITLRDFRIDGGRGPQEPPVEAAPPENAFRVWYQRNGILADQVDGIEMARLDLTNVVHFPVLISRSRRVRIHQLRVAQSGNRNAQGRNNLSGGVLLEEGTSDFQVTDSSFVSIAGNALWTHSLLSSPRLADGLFARNKFENIGRDAIQVGHATRMKVEYNTGDHIGYPFEVVDAENGGTPVALDTAGNVDASEYNNNTFREVNGKCIDLDGFHDGAVRYNTCINPSRARDYPHGHFGIVMNNTFPQAHSDNIDIRGNVIDGAKYGGLFLMGSGNTVIGNRFFNINLAGCNESGEQSGCLYKTDEPDLLQSGIYLGRGVARLEETRGNTIRENQIRGHRMDQRCIVAGPGVALAANIIAANYCEHAPVRQ
jgi:parallel beta-helix repeat protein